MLQNLRAVRPAALHSGQTSLEADLAAIGRNAPARDWAKLPTGYFANLDHLTKHL